MSPRVHVSGGFQKLRFDGEECDVVAGDTCQTTRDFERAAGRYDFTIEGGASRVVVEVGRE